MLSVYGGIVAVTGLLGLLAIGVPARLALRVRPIMAMAREGVSSDTATTSGFHPAPGV